MMAHKKPAGECVSRFAVLAGGRKMQLLSYSKVARFEKELAERTAHTTFTQKRRDLRTGTAQGRTSHTTFVTEGRLRFSSSTFEAQLRSILRVLLPYLKVTRSKLLLRTTFALKGCDVQSTVVLKVAIFQPALGFT